MYAVPNGRVASARGSITRPLRPIGYSTCRFHGFQPDLRSTFPYILRERVGQLDPDPDYDRRITKKKCFSDKSSRNATNNMLGACKLGEKTSVMTTSKRDSATSQALGMPPAIF